ncbi:flavin reductase family protein [Thermus filiformis]|uniref:Flavin oxidoreductase n=1 Tax=Thermus filiformis TaxID=276 RepID=A0A0D6XBL5_THEFI|nr:flavin reductase family protein [Thermus filiformis]KIX84726.1 flavin oxidoreductase [Thermus filiformis]
MGGSRIDPVHFRRTLGRFATGVTVVTVRTGEEVHGMTANAFLSVSLEPPLVLVSVDRKARTHGRLLEAGRYGVSVLSEEQREVSERFAGRGGEGAEVAFVERAGVPLLAGALAHVVARVVEAHPAGDHTLFLGEVEHLDYREGRPLLYYAGRYHRIGGELG